MNKKVLFLFFLLLSVSVFKETTAQQRAANTPNIILILADDMGFSDLGCYGGEVETPVLDKLAEEGLRYKQFYNTARCCPTRASLMTGLYPHQAGMGWMAAADLRTTPAYQGDLNDQCVTIAEVLKPVGYSTYMTGKWHLSRDRKTDGYVMDNWPVQRGFERYFGIVPGGANYFTPMIYSNNHRYRAPKDFYLTDAISDTSVRYIEEHFAQTPEKPFFMYVAYTAPHWPLHAPKEAIEKYKDTYKVGWDALREERFNRQQEIGLFNEKTKLSPRDPQAAEWNTLGEVEKEDMSMRMAIYAAQIDIMDQGIGRIVNSLKEQGQLDNTLIFFLSDNGACAEYISNGKSKAVDGTRETFESYRIEWANLSSTPFKEYKHFTHEGGIATPLIVHWPKGIDSTQNSHYVTEYGHITDIMATCVEVAKAGYPSTFKGKNIVPMQGKSLSPHFKGSTNNRGKVYWEHEANIALRNGKWKLVAKTEEGHVFDKAALQLYDMDADPSEMNDLSKQYPKMVKEMYADWEQWAHNIDAFPLDTREYNVRMNAYRRFINGSFDENLGGWNTRVAGEAKAKITIDNTGKITGEKSALITVNKPGSKPANISLDWTFPVKKGERFAVKFKTFAKNNSNIVVRLETADNGKDKIIDKKLSVKKSIKNYSYQSSKAAEDGNYRLAFYLG
ncbi:MAG TPA: sulfatase-like hydrolase/transferase, partial [Sphingobacterium sp.]|nr:sulfatase-like hydrolase/transferase [Sphingobacterium sp.]